MFLSNYIFNLSLTEVFLDFICTANLDTVIIGTLNRVRGAFIEGFHSGSLQFYTVNAKLNSCLNTI